MTKPAKHNPDTIIPERAPALGVPLRYFLMATGYLAALFLVAIWKAPLLAADYLHNPATLAVTHLFTLGFGGSVVTGALYQMVPVLLYSHLRSERMANVHLALHGMGALLMVVGFLQAETICVIIGGTCVLTGALLLLVNLFLTFRAVERWNWHGLLMAPAILYYVSTLTWGIVMALNQRYGFLGEVEGASLIAHLAMGLIGWFSLMIVGVGLKLVPMFAPAKSLPAAYVAATGGSVALGVLAILLGLWAGRPLFWGGVAVITLGLLTYLGGIGYAVWHRRPGPLDFSVRFAVTAAALVTVPALAFPWVGRQAQAGLALFFALAWIGGTILGMLLRIIPFVVWLHRFRNRVHKLEKIPFLHEMFQPRLGWVAYLAWFPGVAVIAQGMALSAPWLITAGAVLCLAGLGAFSWAVRQVLHHIPPGTPALFPGKKG